MTRSGFVLHAPGRASRAADACARYEYRVWPRVAHPAVSHLQRTWPLVAAESRSDIYLLGSGGSHVLVKLRGGQQLEIKRRTRDMGNIQHWTTPVSTRFPLGAGHRMALANALGLSNGICVEMATSSAHLLSAFGGEALRVVSQTVRKSRLLFETGGCRAEICRIAIGGQTGLTVALEAAELPPIALAIDDLRLGTLPNRSYADMLGHLHDPQQTRPRLLAQIQIHERRSS